MATSTKSTAKKTAKPAKQTVEQPIPYRPTEVERVPLAPISGRLMVETPVAWTKGCEASPDLTAERVVLRSTLTEGDRRWALVDALMSGLTGTDDTETPLQLATEALEDIGAELRVLSTAIGAHDSALWPMQATADRIARRAEMIANLAGKIDRARKEPQHLAAPNPHEMAGALLTMPGVLDGSPDVWERLRRICERLDVAIHVGGPMTEAIGGSHFSVWPRVKGGLSLPYIAVKPGDDKIATVASLLGHAVAKREGFEASDEWRHELAACLLGGHVAQKAVA